MKTSTFYLISLFVICTLSLSAQLREYTADICAGDFTTVTSYCPNLFNFDIEVSGEGTLGDNNSGILEVYVDLDQVDGWNGQIHLISPAGDTFQLATELSFPDYLGPSNNEYLDVGFANCTDLPFHTNPGTPSGLTFYPEEGFASLNNTGGSADGTWTIGICQNFVKEAGPIDLYCASISFGTICPEIDNVIVTDADCNQSNGSVELVLGESGYCNNLIVYSLDGIEFEFNNTFTDLSAGNYTAYVAHATSSLLTQKEQEELKSEGTIHRSLVPGECITEFTFTIGGSTDNQDPVITNCPANQTVSLDANCSVEFFITEPFYNDDCGIDPANSGLVITNPAGESSVDIVDPGGTYPYEWGATGVFTFDWFVTDLAGNTSTCQTQVTIQDENAPTWTTQEITVDIECGVENIDDVVSANLSNLIAIDCGSVNYDFSENIIMPQCGNSEWNDWYYTVTDDAGNVSPFLGAILINVNDNLAPTLTGIPVDDITISCADNFPSIPEIGVDIFANDLCAGDVTSSITLTSSLTLGDCTQGEPIETQTFSYSVNDGCGNIEIQSFSVLIYNDVAPVWDAPYSSSTPLSMTLECGVDDLLGSVAANMPTAQGCSGPTVISESSLQASNLCPTPSNTSASTYTYQAIDECNNINFASVNFEYVDTQAPTLNGIPANVTINCNESLPQIPDVTAMDICEGDVTSLIEYELNVSELTCDFGQNAFVETHVWTAYDYCGNNVSASWTVTAFNDEAVDLGDNIVACTGDVVTLQSNGLNGNSVWSTGENTSSIVVTEAGEYFVTVTGASGCCSVDNVFVEFQDYPDASATGGTLDCNGSNIQLIGNSSSSTVSYSWTGPGGFTSNDQSPIVSQAGTYTLTVATTAGCFETANAIVQADTDAPDISTEGGTIDCNTSEVVISGTSTTQNVSYSWAGPNGFTSSNPSVSVANPGEYNLTVTAPNGCIAEGVAIVVDDVVIPTVSVIGGTINCNNPNVTLTTSTSDPTASFEWTGPNGFTSNEQDPMVDAAGTYTLMVTSNNGCTAETTASVNIDTLTPDLAATGGTLTCTSTSVQLNATSTTTGVTYLWSGPNGFTNTTANPSVNIAGDYTVVVTASNGCNSSQSVTVIQDISNPIAAVANGVITCDQPSITLMPTASDGVSYAWTGPGGFTSSEQNPVVNVAGTYTLVVASANGCTASANSVVSENTTTPTITVQNNLTINCTNTSAQILLSTNNTGLTYSWTGPAAFASSEQNPIIDVAGIYTVVATAQNGCTSTATSSVIEDLAIPNASASGGELNCSVNVIQINGSSTSPGVSYSWTGPNSFSSNEQNPSVGSPGIYTLTVTAANGCMATATAQVNASSELPNISAFGGLLNCNINEVQLMGSSTTSGTSFQWSGPGGFNSTETNPTVGVPGQYTFTVTAPNGCISESVVSVTLDNTAPSLDANGGQISCNQSSITLTSNSSQDVSYEWTGPNGFTSNEQNPMVTNPGSYTIQVIGENGCSAQTTVQVTLDNDLPNASLASPSVDCENNVITLNVETNNVYTYNWMVNGNIISSNQSIGIWQEGNYTVEVIATNGCSLTFGYMLEEDFVNVTAEIETVNADSNQNGSASIELNYDNITSILWDNGDTGASANDLTPGIHTVTVTTNLGCVYTFDFEIEMNTAIQEINFIEEFKIYPTVTTDIINLEVNFSISTSPEINIFSTQGQLVKTEKFSNTRSLNTEFDLSNLSAGTYIISLRADGKIKTTRIVKI